ncbi:hypothetical protein [Actinomadura madurae]|uniref:hypothetical protein n=1 Tax=Actinomadura madurae TaxID=1993 RepID=UPI0020D20C6E|nr:hypothetical protein [Actinomadura madurae]MCP9967349.1 hypothetical protein [Actinomadura madurae]MCP9979810.1 hypothetical protein [Actinomadura madurae]
MNPPSAAVTGTRTRSSPSASSSSAGAGPSAATSTTSALSSQRSAVARAVTFSTLMTRRPSSIRGTTRTSSAT